MNSEQWRVQFDAEVTFTNGGALQAQEFRLDAPGPRISDGEVGELFVRHLGLLMAGEVAISNKQLLREPHKGSRGTVGAERQHGRRVVDLSRTADGGVATRLEPPAPAHPSAPTFELLSLLADLDGVVVRVLGGSAREIEREVLLPYDLTGKAVLLHTGWEPDEADEQSGHEAPFLTADAAEWLVRQRPALVGIDAPGVDGTSDGSHGDTNDGTHDDAIAGAHRARTTLSAAGIPVVRHLRGLEQLPPHGFRFHAVPPVGDASGACPVRAYAVVGS